MSAPHVSSGASVWVVYYDAYETTPPEGVFSTEEAAQEWVGRQDLPEDYFIEKFTLDALTTHRVGGDQ